MSDLFPEGVAPRVEDSLEITFKKLLDALVNGKEPAATIFPEGAVPLVDDPLTITAKKILEVYNNS